MKYIRNTSSSSHGKGVVGDNSTDPLAANSRTGSADEVSFSPFMKNNVHFLFAGRTKGAKQHGTG